MVKPDMKQKTVVILLVAAVAGLCIGLGWWWMHASGTTGELVLYGNVDLRQAELAFNNSGRIVGVLAQEGDLVHRGQLLARLDTSRLKPQFDLAQAQADAQRQVVERLHNGNRPEEIAQARANLESAKADAANARQNYDRLNKLAHGSEGRAVTQQDLDNAKATLDVADAKVAVNQKALDLEVLGPRKEDIAQAEALLRGNDAQLALLQQELSDAQLFAPSEGVIRSRLMEPGEMASTTKPVFSLAIIDPKWVRA
jgi:HlyD family secretion protein